MFIRRARRDERPALLDIWLRAVQRTHSFLSADDIEFYYPLVRDSYLPHAELWIAVDAEERPLGFIGLAGSKAESLFVDPDHFGRGVGRALVEHAFRIAGPLRIDVNEQNSAARAFYGRIGFQEVGRSELDDLGRPFPLIHLAAGQLTQT